MLASLATHPSAPARFSNPPWLALGLLVAITAAASAADKLPADKLQFNRDIRPILSENCFLCHGPDSASRQADLRLDVREQAVADRSGVRALAPGQVEASELVRRILAVDPEERMPPAKSALKLTAKQIDLLKRWIAEGAEYQPHWSFLPLQRAEPPQVTHPPDIVHPIDRFIRARLAREGLSPAAEADKATLLRRVTFDLTGLPPGLAEVDACLADGSAAAYDRLVDRLLASPQYGERMASMWLDAARYADTNGYQSDGPRFMWRWRDWVIEAFNRNLPFDQFTIEQLAGDLLPQPTREQLIATGFNRNHRGNSEGGIIPEEYLVEYAVDRVDTTATVWLGLTVGCARCHDHKFDPISQREFYQLLAFFNGVPELGKVTRDGNSVPLLKAPTREQELHLAQLQQEVSQAQRKWQRVQPELDAAQLAWEAMLAASFEAMDWTIEQALTAHLPFEGSLRELVKGQEGTSAGDSTFAAGRLGSAALLDGQNPIQAGDVADFGESDRFSIAAWIQPTADQAMSILSRMDEENSLLGYELHYNRGKIQVNLVNRILDDAIRVETQATFAPGAWRHVLFTYDASKVAAGVQIYVDGRPQPLKVISDNLSNAFRSTQPLRIGIRGTTLPFIGLIDEVRCYGRELSASEAAVLACSDSIRHIAGLKPADRSAEQAQKIALCFLDQACPLEILEARTRLHDASAKHAEFLGDLPTTMVMQEKPGPREAPLLIRGQYDKPGEVVAAGVPASLPPLSASLPGNRLGLAQWLVDPENPLTARVAVNRFWQMLFGEGLVRTAEDFGSQGEPPSHPELLDWLAADFIRSGWDVKRLHKLIVSSGVYRQSSKITPQLWARDPENRLLARGPRFRLPAEMIRDSALSLSGLLVQRLGGPSVKPYQPAGLWEELGTNSASAYGSYQQDSGESLYRRSLYTYWKRTVPPPAMMTFDAAGREMCTVRQSRTNTPLQALNLMNDVTYVEAARVLAAHAMRKADTPAAQIDYLFRRALARAPGAAERVLLMRSLERQRRQFQDEPALAAALLATGNWPADKELSQPDLAALATVASIVLNLDEAITKE